VAELFLRRYPTPYVDRGGLLSRVSAELIDGNDSVVAILGPPGAGKTRLAIEVLAEIRGAFSAGALAFVELRTASPGEA
jgi:ABC-type hemin transport system ATPase subunit